MAAFFSRSGLLCIADTPCYSQLRDIVLLRSSFLLGLTAALSEGSGDGEE